MRGIMVVIALALVIMTTFTAYATLVDIMGIKLKNTSFRAQTAEHAKDVISLFCNTEGCSTERAAFSPATFNVTCPSGGTCTYEITFNARLEVSTSDSLLFKFLVDGRPPSPGPTSTNGLVSVAKGQQITGFETRTFTTISQGLSPGNHSIEIRVAIQDSPTDTDTTADGLVAERLTVRVYRP